MARIARQGKFIAMKNTLTEELSWRGFVNQSTFNDISELDKQKYRFYWGVDPSSNSMTVGNLATAMMVRHFIDHGHIPFLLIGGATGLIGDPDGKSEERSIQSKEQIETNKKAISEQYKRIFAGSKFTLVDNLDWFKDHSYLDFLRDIGKHVPLSQMIGRDFVQSRLKSENSGISYAEFSYVMIQAFDFYHLHKEHAVNLQVAGSDQWGNSIAGVDLIRRLSGDTAHVFTAPLVVNPQTGVKFGKSEQGAIWLDPKLTSITAFYQFWVNSEDEAVEQYLKIFTMLDQAQIEEVMLQQNSELKKDRPAQFKLADEVTALVHGEKQAASARRVTSYLTGNLKIAEASSEDLDSLRQEIPVIKSSLNSSIIGVLVSSGLAASNTSARQLLGDGAVYINSKRAEKDYLEASDFTNGRLLIRRGKAFRDSALVELANA